MNRIVVSIRDKCNSRQSRMTKHASAQEANCAANNMLSSLFVTSSLCALRDVGSY